MLIETEFRNFGILSRITHTPCFVYSSLVLVFVVFLRSVLPNYPTAARFELGVHGGR